MGAIATKAVVPKTLNCLPGLLSNPVWVNKRVIAGGGYAIGNDDEN